MASIEPVAYNFYWLTLAAQKHRRAGLLSFFQSPKRNANDFETGYVIYSPLAVVSSS